MAEAKWSGVLSTTEPRNDVGIIKVRQGNINSEIAEFQIVQNNKPYDLTGLTVYFCASFGLNLVEKPAVVKNTTGGRIQYTFDDDSMQSVGRQKGYFSIKKAESKIDSTQEFEFQVESSLMTRSIDGKSYIYKLSTLIKVLDDFIKNGQNNFNTWFDSVKEILYGVDPGGNILRELIEARKNSSGNIFASLKARLDKNEDDTVAQLAQTEKHLIKGIINVESLNVYGNGSNETLALKEAIEYAADNHLTLFIPSYMTILIDAMDITNKTDFGLDCKGTIKRIDNAPTVGFMLRFINCHNVYVPNINLDGNALNNGCVENVAYTPSQEQKHSLGLDNSTSIDIGIAKVINPCGDGIYITNGSKDIHLNKLIGRADKKIGRNILSVIHASNLYIHTLDSVGIGHYDMPGGFDIEPNLQSQTVENIHINNLHIESAGSNVLSVLNTNGSTVKDVFINNANIISTHILDDNYRACAFLSGENIIINNLIADGNNHNAHILVVDSLGGITEGVFVNNLIGTNGVWGLYLGGTGHVKNVHIKATLRNLSSDGIRMVSTEDVQLDIDISGVGDSKAVILSAPTLETKNINLTVTGDISKRGTGLMAVNSSASIDQNKNWIFNDLDFTGWDTDKRLKGIGTGLSDITKSNCKNLTHMPTRPNFEAWRKGDIVYNTNPLVLGVVGNQYIIDKWIAKTNGSGSDIWIESKIYTGT